MQSEYAAAYRELYERHWWWRARERLILDTLRSRRPAGGWRAILDVGCGDGLLFDRLLELGSTVEGVEADATLVSPSGPHRHRITVGSFDSTFQPGKRYSLILMLDVLEHLSDPTAALRHAVGLLDGDGIFLATVPAFMSLWTNHDVLNQHVTRYTRGGVLGLAADARLQLDSVRYFFHWTYPAKIAVRALEALSHVDHRPPRVPAKWLNHSLYAASVLEQKLLGKLPVPFGSSILFLGRSIPGAPGFESTGALTR